VLLCVYFFDVFHECSRLQSHELNHCDREAEVLKAIANGLAVRCRKRKEENMIKQLKILHQKRQEQNSKSLHSRKQSLWAKIEATQEMVALAKNFRFVRLSHVSDTMLMQFSDKLRLNQTWEGRLKGKYPTIWNLKTWTENFLTTLRGCGLQGNLCRKGAVKSKYDENSSVIILEQLHAGPEDDSS
jgi:hypothetical protein